MENDSQKKFNLRCYGILQNEDGEILTSREKIGGNIFNKFPGGGINWGEGIEDALKREFKEELGLKINVGELIYVNSHFLASKFRINDQVFCFYYTVYPAEKLPENYQEKSFTGLEPDIKFEWKLLNNGLRNFFELPLDQIVVDTMLKNSAL